ncbi:MAG: TonB-dependent receptor [Gammaproteobacteria bacterium]|nr:TonB-dependent receptor [Gammaproteobacteria bacterium]
MQFTIGGLYWNEEVDQSDQNHFAIAAGNICIQPDISQGGAQAPAGFNLCNDSAPWYLATHSRPITPFMASQPGVHAGKPVDNIQRETDHWSAFGSLQFDMSEDVLLTLDLRYIDEEVTLTGPNTDPGAGQQTTFQIGPDQTSICGVSNCEPFEVLNIFPPGPPIIAPGPPNFGPNFVEDNGGVIADDPAIYAVAPTSQRTFNRTDDYWAPAASLVWSTTDNSSIYWSFSQGRTPGGLTMTPLRTVGFGIDPDHNGSPNEIAFNSERITSLEFGGDISTVNNTLDLNVGLFFQRIDNRQVVTQSLSIDCGTCGTPPDPTDDENILVDSIAGEAQVDVFGIELGFRWQPNDHWNIAAEYTYLNSEYDSFSVLSDNASQITAAGNCRAMTVGGIPTCGIDLAGNEVAGVPENAFIGEISYIAPLANTGIDWFIATNSRFQGARFVNASNTASVSDYWISDLRLGVTTDRWDVVFYVDNVFDNEIVQYAYEQADTAHYQARIGVCTFEIPIPPPFDRFAALCDPANPSPNRPANLTDPNYPIATIANQPDPQRWGIRAGFRF